MFQKLHAGFECGYLGPERGDGGAQLCDLGIILRQPGGGPCHSYLPTLRPRHDREAASSLPIYEVRS